MNRPSHWILACFGVLAVSLVTSGRLATWLEGVPPSPAGDPATTAGSPTEADAVSLRTSRPLIPSTTVGGLIRGRVIDRFGWPVAGVGVDVLDGSTTPARTAADGSFEVKVDGLGLRRVGFETADQFHLEELVSSAPPCTVVLPDPVPWQNDRAWAGIGPIDRPAVLAGETSVELPDGSPAVGAWVAVRETGAMSRTDERGRARLPLRPRETATLVAWSEDGQAVASRPAVPGRNAGLVPLPDLEFEDGFTFRGTVRGPNGGPIPAPVRLREGRVVRETDPDAEGYFTFRGLVGGVYELEILPYRGLLGCRKSVDVANDVDLEVELERDAPLQLRVVDRGANALAGVHVVARDDGDRRAHGVTDREGEIMVRGLDRELVEFEVRDAALEPLLVDSWAPDQRVLVVAKP